MTGALVGTDGGDKGPFETATKYVCSFEVKVFGLKFDILGHSKVCYGVASYG